MADAMIMRRGGSSPKVIEKVITTTTNTVTIDGLSDNNFIIFCVPIGTNTSIGTYTVESISCIDGVYRGITTNSSSASSTRYMTLDEEFSVSGDTITLKGSYRFKGTYLDYTAVIW